MRSKFRTCPYRASLYAGKPLLFLAIIMLWSMCSLAQTTPLSFSQIPLSDPDIPNPGRGAEEWMAMNQVNVPLESAVSVPFDAYYRFEWTEIEKGQGVYDWTALDAAFQRAINKRQKFSFGIMPICGSCTGTTVDGSKLTYPLYLHNLMQGESVKDWSYNAMWIPNWNSNHFLTAWENMLKAVSAHINSTYISNIKLSSIVNYIDIRGYGNWGEWHGYPYANNEPPASQATSATLLRIVNAHKNAFPDIRLVAMSDAFDIANWSKVPAEVGHYLLTASNNAGQFGWRRDNWGDPASWYRAKLENNSTTYNGQTFSTLIMNKWMYAPIVGEPSSCCTINGGSCQYWELTDQVKRYHALSFGNGNLESSTSSCVRDNIRNAASASGYRLVVESGSMSSSMAAGAQFTINLNWKNIGITPVYENWKVVYQLRTSTNTLAWEGTSYFKPTMFLPQSTSTAVQDNFTLPLGTPAGTYQLVMLVVDPNGYRRPLSLGISGRNTDGSYLLRSVTVAPGTVANNAPKANAGTDKTITLPTNAVTLDGSLSADSDGSIVRYSWSQAGGPGGSIFTDSSKATASVNSLVQGVYLFRLTVTDDKGATGSDTVAVTVNAAPAAPAPTPLSLTITDIDLKCNGANNGTATVTVSGGTAPYSYSWNTVPVQTTATAYNLAAGTYMVTVRDAAGQTASASTVLTQPSPLVLTVTPGTITTYGGTTSVTLGATGGTAPYTFSGPTTNVAAGTYTYGVTDAKGCTAYQTVTITQPAQSTRKKLRGTYNWSSAGGPVSTIPEQEGAVALQFRLYPVPATTTLNMSFQGSDMGRGMISVISVNGTIMMSKAIEKNSTYYQGSIDVSRLPRGTYYLRMQIGTTTPLVKTFMKL